VVTSCPLQLSDIRLLADRDSRPLYRKVKRTLQQAVEAGRYRPGDALPSESALAQALGVSIGTLRKAVDELVHEHILVRHQGKGTYVTAHHDERVLFQFFSVEPRADAAGQGSRGRGFPTVDCVGFLRSKADEDEAATLRIRPGEAVFRIDNRLSLAGRPVVHDQLVVPVKVFKGLTEKRFVERSSTVYSLYQNSHGVTVLHVRERARATAAGIAVARVLGIAVGLPVLEVHRIALTFGERPVEYRISTINTTAHDYVSLLTKRN
jgi:GntR family transcriptional regulator